MFNIDRQAVELLPLASRLFLGIVTEAKSLYYRNMSKAGKKRLDVCLARILSTKPLKDQLSLRFMQRSMAGKDPDTMFLNGVRRGLAVDATR